MSKSRIMVVDDEKWMLEVCRDILGRLPETEILIEVDSERALERIATESLDLLITDLMMPGLNGLELLDRAREYDPNLAVLMITAHPTVETAVTSMKLGAADYLVKPFLPEDLLAAARRLIDEKSLRDQVRLLQRSRDDVHIFDNIIGASKEMQNVFDVIERVAETDMDVLITGETGTGKELIARSIHQRSNRHNGRFVPVNCAAIPEDLLESELFGYEKGAFTGAQSRSLGLMEYASGGTFFLDEVNELSRALQPKLLRVLEDRKIRRLGGKDEIPVDIRIVTASARNIENEVESGRFRKDLYYRINVFQIDLPPLRERVTDIPLLISHFCNRYASEKTQQIPEIDEVVMQVLCQYSWPGNVRELQNMIRRLMALNSDKIVTADMLPESIVPRRGVQSFQGAADGDFDFDRSRDIAVFAFERSFLDRLLKHAEGDVSQAAKLASIQRSRFYRLLERTDINPDDYRPQ